MAVVAVLRGISLPKIRDLPLLFALGFFAVSLHHVALNFGQQSVSAGASSVLAQSTPLFSTLLARFVFKDRVSAWRWGCVLLGLIGVVIVVAGDHGLGSIDTHGLLILLAAVSWSFYFALQKHHSRRYDGLTLVCYTVWFGTLLLLVYLPGLVSQVITAPVEVQLAVIGLGIFPSALAYLAWAYVLTHVDLSRATMTLYLIPPTAMAIASFALGERPTLMIVGGALVVLVSVLALNLERRLVIARVTEA
jgi:drug/metabolite transporter (DMT)-like permease